MAGISTAAALFPILRSSFATCLVPLPLFSVKVAAGPPLPTSVSPAHCAHVALARVRPQDGQRPASAGRPREDPSRPAGFQALQVPELQAGHSQGWLFSAFSRRSERQPDRQLRRMSMPLKLKVSLSEAPFAQRAAYVRAR